MIVHFPIALIVVGFLADLFALKFKKEICLSKAGFYLMILGTLGAIFAQITGFFFTNHPESGAIAEVFERHESMALVTVIIMVLGSLLRIYLMQKKKEDTKLQWIVFLFYLAGTISVGLTGFLGGTMVFDYMTGL